MESKPASSTSKLLPSPCYRRLAYPCGPDGTRPWRSAVAIKPGNYVTADNKMSMRSESVRMRWRGC